MQRSRKIVLIAAGLAAFAIAGAVLLYSGFRRGGAADASACFGIAVAKCPPGAPTLIYIDLAAMRASTFYQHRPDPAPITLPDRDYANFIAATGFDFENDLDQVVIASWPQSLAQDPKRTIVFAEGRFDRQKIRDYALHKGKLDRGAGTHEVYAFSGLALRLAVREIRSTRNRLHWCS